MILDKDKECLYEKLTSLLREIDEICRNNDIPYFLIEEALAAAVRGVDFPKDRRLFSVAIYAEDVKRFIDIVNGITHREVESVMNNPRFPGFYLKYIDVDTTMYNASETRSKYVYNAIGINICILFNKKKKAGRYEALNDNIQAIRVKLLGHNGRSIKKSIFLAVCSIFSSIFNAESAFERYLNSNRSGKNRMVFLSNGEKIVLNESMFGKGTDVSINNYLYSIPDEAEAAALMTNKESLSLNKKGNPYKVNSRDIVSFTYPGYEYINSLKKNNINVKKSAKKYIRYQNWRRNKYVPVWKKREKFYSYYGLVRDRFYFYDQFCGERKNELLTMFNDEKYDELYGVLSEYIDLLIKYDQMQMGLFFDKEIYVITIKVIEHFINKVEKNEGFANGEIEKLRKNIDKVFWQHLQPIDKFENGEKAEEEKMEIIRDRIKHEIMC